MSLYRFKSRETGDLVMLHPNGERILQILGKNPDAPGIIQPQEMGHAVLALHEAVAADEADQQRLQQEALAKGEPAPVFEKVNLRMRCAPFIEMLQRCEKAKVEVVWGV
jgi:hypothetical protein